MTMRATKVWLTQQEYLEGERLSEVKHEYYNGEVFERPSVSFRHNQITRNLICTLSQRLRGNPCEALGRDMRVKVPLMSAYLYPDLVVVCGHPELEDAVTDTLLNPTVVVEVLSPSTETYDRTTKLDGYCALPSVKVVLLVAQDRPRVELHSRDDANGWRLIVMTGQDATVDLTSLGCQLTLADVYERVTFPDAPASSHQVARPTPSPLLSKG